MEEAWVSEIPLGGDNSACRLGALILDFLGGEREIFITWSHWVWEGRLLQHLECYLNQHSKEVGHYKRTLNEILSVLCTKAWAGCAGSWAGFRSCLAISCLCYSSKGSEPAILKVLKVETPIIAWSLSSEEILGESETWKVGQGFFDFSSILIFLPWIGV